MKLEEQPLLKFKDYKIVKINAELGTSELDEPIDKDLEVELRTIPNFFSEKDFSIDFILKITDKSERVKIEILAIANFSSHTVISEEYKKSGLISVNAPAIIFPYLRAFVSTLTVNAGFNPIVLPTFNFTAIGKKGN